MTTTPTSTSQRPVDLTPGPPAPAAGSPGFVAARRLAPVVVPLLLVAASLAVGVLVGFAPLVVLAALAAISLVALILTNLAMGLTVFAVIQFFALLPFFGGEQDLTVVKLTGALLAVGWVIVIVRSRTHGTGRGVGLTTHHPALVVLLLLFLVWGGLSFLWALEPDRVYPDLERYILNVILFAIVFTAVRKPVHAVWIAGALALGTAVGTLSSSFFPSSGDSSRLAGPIGDPNELAAALVPGIILAIALAGTLRSRGWRIAFLVAAAVGLGGLFLTASRGGLIALAVAMVVWMAIGGRWRLRLAAVIGLAVGGGGLYYLIFVPADLASRVTAAGDGSGRLDIWLLGWRVFEDRPWLGAGMGNFTAATPHYLVEPGLVARADRIITVPKIAHNMYLSMLTELGMVGFALFVGIIVVSLVLMLQAVVVFSKVGDHGMDMLSRAYVASLSGLLAADFFLSGQYEKPLWLLLGMGPALLLIARREAAAASSTSAAS